VRRRIFGPKREEVAVDWRRLHNEELHNLYASPNVIRVIKLGRTRWAGACSTHGMDEKCIQNSGRKNLEGRDHAEDLGIDERIILDWILGKQGRKL
jgi:hypothetical protein